MKRIICLLPALCLLLSCKESDTDMNEKDPVYVVESIEYRLLSCDTVEVFVHTGEYVAESVPLP